MATNINEAGQQSAIAKVQLDSVTLLDKTKALVVTDQKTHDQAIELYKAALQIEKDVHAAHDPVCDHWNRLHKAATATRKADLDKVVQAKKLAKSKGDAWELQQEEIRLAEERRLQEEARMKAEAEARKAREEAERLRAEQQKQEEAERLRLAEQAEQAGASEEEVSAILDTPLQEPEPIPEQIPEPIPLPTVAPSYQKAEGVKSRWHYSGELVSLQQLIVAAATNAHLQQYLQPNESAINALARSSKDAFRLPGCKLRKVRV